MKKQWMLAALPAMMLACGPSGPTTDPANDAAGTGSPYEARRVTGTRLLTTDYHYDKLCNFLDDGFIRGTFEVDPLSKLTVLDSQRECTYQWGDDEVKVILGGNQPHRSMYDAERTFDERYQPRAVDEIDTKPRKPSLFGPRPQGTGAERPATQSPKPENDSQAIVQQESAKFDVKTRLTEPAYATDQAVVVRGVGDKALWIADDRTLNVLYLQHIFSVKVNTNSSLDKQRKQAITLAMLIIDELGDAERMQN